MNMKQVCVILPVGIWMFMCFSAAAADTNKTASTTEPAASVVNPSTNEIDKIANAMFDVRMDINKVNKALEARRSEIVASDKKCKEISESIGDLYKKLQDKQNELASELRKDKKYNELLADIAKKQEIWQKGQEEVRKMLKEKQKNKKQAKFAVPENNTGIK